MLNQTATSSFHGFVLLENNVVSCLSSLRLKMSLLEFAQVVQVHKRCHFSIVRCGRMPWTRAKKSPELSMSE